MPSVLGGITGPRWKAGLFCSSNFSTKQYIELAFYRGELSSAADGSPLYQITQGSVDDSVESLKQSVVVLIFQTLYRANFFWDEYCVSPSADGSPIISSAKGGMAYP